jgi:hypothetical protein
LRGGRVVAMISAPPAGEIKVALERSSGEGQ